MNRARGRTRAGLLKREGRLGSQPHSLLGILQRPPFSRGIPAGKNAWRHARQYNGSGRNRAFIADIGKDDG